MRRTSRRSSPPTPVPGLPITGTYGWVVNSSGDANNNPGVSSIGNESGQLQPANPGLSTDTSPPQVTLSSGSPPILTDPATLSGAFEETGTTTFDLYAPGGTVPIHTEIVSVSGNGTYTTAIGYTLPTTGTVTGTYQWVASYSGDADNNSVASAKGNRACLGHRGLPVREHDAESGQLSRSISAARPR